MADIIPTNIGHTGSWGLPDYGITEKISNAFFGSDQTGQGGSDIFKNNPQNLQNPQETWTNPTLNQQYQQNAAYQPGVNSPQVGAAYALQNKLKADQLTATDIPKINSMGGGGNAQSQDALIAKYRASGWNDINAILNDIKAGGASKFTGGGGNGGGNKDKSTKGDPREGLVVGTEDYKNSGMSMDEYLASIDNEYNTSNNYLNEAESNLNADRASTLANLEKQRGTLKDQAYTTKEDAQTAARRLYSELQQGYRQRFGGASSAGEAAMALTQNEQQRQMAANNRTYQTALTQIDTSADSAVQQAQAEFRNLLSQITQNRTLLVSQKEQAKRQAIQTLAAQTYQIQQQRQTLKDNITLMQEQARINNASRLSELTSNPTSNLTFDNRPTTASGNVPDIQTAVGSIANPQGTSRGVNVDDFMRKYANPYAR